MRKVFLFLAGLLLVAVMCGAMFVAAAIYQTSNKATVVPYFFQPANNPVERPGVPVSPDDLGANATDLENSQMYRRLISRYITQMFYVTPDSTVEARYNALRHMALSNVLNTWQEFIAPEIKEMAMNKVLRTVHVIDIVPEGDYHKVEYELKTWNKPNDMNALPEITYGTVYLKVYYKPGIRQEMVRTGQTVTEYLENGGDPAAVFRFGIEDMAIPQ